MVTDKEGKIFDNRRKKSDRRNENIKVEEDRRKTNRRDNTKKNKG